MISSSSSLASSVEVEGDNNLLTEVLLHLPPTFLFQFKTVSKRWLSLISDPYFTPTHSLRYTPSISGIFLPRFAFDTKQEFLFIPLNTNLKTSPFKSLTFHPDPCGIQIQQSCNGLLCCCSYRTGQNDRTFYIYNPITKHYSTLPNPCNDIPTTKYTIRSVSLAFDPCLSPNYKAVCIWSVGNYTNYYQISIYSSSHPTNSWRLSGDVFTAHNDLFHKSGVFWKGALHWANVEKLSFYFDVDKETLLTMPMPSKPIGWNSRMIEYFGASRDHLHLIERYEHCSKLDIFEMETDYSGWNVKYHVNLDSVASVYPDMVWNRLDVLTVHRYTFCVLLVHGEEDLVVLHIPGKVIAYNLKDNTAKELKDLSPGPYLRYQWFDSYQFIESFACV